LKDGSIRYLVQHRGETTVFKHQLGRWHAAETK
jgi:hypothetical protein